MTDEVQVNGTLKWRHIGVLAGAVAALVALHSAIMVPAIASVAVEKAQQQIEIHRQTIHPGAVSQAEFQATLKRIEEHLRRIDEKLNRVRIRPR